MITDNFNSEALETRLHNLESTMGLVLGILEKKEEMPQKETLISVKQLCEMLGTSYVTIWKRMKNNELPYRRLGRRIYFDPAEVRAAMKTNVNPERENHQKGYR